MLTSSPITLYHGTGTRSVRVRWVLEEMGLPYELRPVAFPARVRQPAYLDVNPLGSLPALVDGEVFMTESMAICEYLSARYGPTPLVVGPQEPGFAAYRQFCWYGEASLVQPVGAIFRYTRLEPPERRIGQVVSDSREVLARRLAPVSQALEQRPYLAGERLTLADVSVAYALGFASWLGEGAIFPPQVVAYRERLEQRAAYRRAYDLDPLEPAAPPVGDAMMTEANL